MWLLDLLNLCYNLFGLFRFLRLLLLFDWCWLRGSFLHCLDLASKLKKSIFFANSELDRFGCIFDEVKWTICHNFAAIDYELCQSLLT